MKKVFIILFLITILFFLVTTNLVLKERIKIYSLKKYTNTNPSTSDDVKDKKNESKGLYAKYHDNVDDGITKMISKTYNENPIKIEYVHYEDEKITGQHIKISGLKNKEIENKINEKIKDDYVTYISQCYDEVYEYYFNKNTRNALWKNGVFEDTKLIGYQTIMANFSNVISLKTYLKTVDLVKVRYQNINLNTGENLKIEELFTSGINLEELVISTYKEACEKHVYYEELPKEVVDDKDFSEEMLMRGIFYTTIDENKLLQYANAFNYSEQIDFFFTPRIVNIKLLNIDSEICFDENNCAIYDRFKDDSIFEDTTLGYKDILCFNNVTMGNYIQYYRNELVDDIKYEYFILSPEKENDVDLKKIVSIINEKLNSDVNGALKEKKDDQLLYVSGVFGIFKGTPYNHNASDLINKENYIYSYTYMPIIMFVGKDDNFDINHEIVNVYSSNYNILQVDFCDAFDSNNLYKANLENSLFNNHYYDRVSTFILDKELNNITSKEQLVKYVSTISENAFEIVSKIFEKEYQNNEYLIENKEPEIIDKEFNVYYYEPNIEIPDITVRLKDKKHEWIDSYTVLSFIYKYSFDDELYIYFSPW